MKARPHVASRAHVVQHTASPYCMSTVYFIIHAQKRCSHDPWSTFSGVRVTGWSFKGGSCLVEYSTSASSHASYSGPGGSLDGWMSVILPPLAPEIPSPST